MASTSWLYLHVTTNISLLISKVKLVPKVGYTFLCVMHQGYMLCITNAINQTYSALWVVEICLHHWCLLEGQPFLVEAQECLVEEKSPLPLPDEGAGTGSRSLLEWPVEKRSIYQPTAIIFVLWGQANIRWIWLLISDTSCFHQQNHAISWKTAPQTLSLGALTTTDEKCHTNYMLDSSVPLPELQTYSVFSSISHFSLFN